jgi:hypothetical protein
LWEIVDGKLLQFRCHIGHLYSEQGLEAAESEKLEEALWSALRVLEENAALHRQLRQRAQENGLQGLERAHGTRLQEVERRAALIRGVLMSEDERVTLDLQQPIPTTSINRKLRPAARRASGKMIQQATQVSAQPRQLKPKSDRSKSRKKRRH